jgi:bleomycin hydrolase
MSECEKDPVFKITRQALGNNSWESVFMDYTSLPESTRETQFLANQSVRSSVNQENSGTCWIHATLSYYRDLFLKRFPKLENDRVRFSIAYILFYHLYESCDAFLKRIETFIKDKVPMNDPRVCWTLDHILSDGASGNTGYILVKKYGIVPYDIMGSNEQVKNTEKLIEFLKRVLIHGIAKMRTHKTPGEVRRNIMPIIYKYLCVAIGTPPKKFEYEFRGTPSAMIKTKSPLDFYKKYLKPNDIGCVYMSTYTNLPSGSWYRYKNTETITNSSQMDHSIQSVSPKELLNYVVNNLQKKRVVYVGVNISKDFSEEYGWGHNELFNPEMLLTKKEKGYLQVKREDLTNVRGYTPNHAVLIVGYRTNNGKKNGAIEHFLIENSWGSESGKEGHIRVSPEWFLENVLEASIPKDILAKKRRNPSKIQEYECYETIGNLL